MTSKILEDNKTLEKVYDPKAIEAKWYPHWEKQAYFSAAGDKTKPYCIVIPPPNVTGTLHMGHALEASLMDTLIRFHRMDGDNTLWQVGTDHAGIATQMVVERKLQREQQLSRYDLGRDEFIKKVWEWKQESGGQITQQLRRMGASPDWSRERFTMDPGLSNAVQKVFIQLYDEGLIYRGKRLVNWDPVLHTAISDLEVEQTTEASFLWHIRYVATDGSGELVVATTRPETLFGDVAVAVNPDDERFKSFIGKSLKLPLTDRVIPVIADDHVDVSFGTGCLKVTPAHDFNDHRIGAKHGLPLINILTHDAKLNTNVPKAYQGLDRFVARERVEKDLKDAGLLVEKKPHENTVPRGDRSNAIIEPLLTDQWFVRIEPLAKPAVAAVETGAMRFVPENWANTFYAWMRDIEDWCISRQIWWGHRIPAWYDDKDNIYVGETEAAVRAKYNLAADLELRQDADVLDTWFSAALWPFSTLGWPEKTPELSSFYPTSVLITGFDIIFFWVARMLMFGLKFMGEVPFREVYIHGLIRDHEGQKMSKSKGNVLDPLDIIDGIDLESLVKKRTSDLMQPEMAPHIERATRKEFSNGISSHGTDALRFTLCSQASTGRNIPLDMARVEGYRNFCNKIWNAARYVLMIVSADTDLGVEAFELSPADRWIMSKLQHTITSVRDALNSYRFDLAVQTIYDFVWYNYCDWYLEISKPMLNSKSVHAAARRGTQKTLICVLETILRLLHPMMPFITEELWQQIAPLANMPGATIMLAPYPQTDANLIDVEAEKTIEWMMQLITLVRNIRGEMNVNPGRAISLLLKNGSAEDKQRLDKAALLIEALAKINHIQWLQADEAIPAQCAASVLGSLDIYIPLAGLIDLSAERQRLAKELAKTQAELAKCTAKLANENFTARAPAEVVAEEKQRAAEFQLKAAGLEDKIKQLGA